MQRHLQLLMKFRLNFYEVTPMITLTDNEVVLIRSLLTALRGIKIREIDKALVILAKADRREKPSVY